MTQDELKLVLEALKEAQTNDDGMEKWDRNKKAIAVVEKALAQPEQEPVATLFGSLPVYDTIPPQRTEQEPVAWMLDGEFYKTQQFHLQGGHYANQIPLYTTPPQRTWVGLTDEEIDSCFEDHGWSPSESYYPVIKDIEAKLKQKNGFAEEKNT